MLVCGVFCRREGFGIYWVGDRFFFFFSSGMIDFLSFGMLGVFF